MLDFSQRRRPLMRGATVAVSAVAAICFALPALAQDNPSATATLVSLDVRDAQLKDAVHALTARSGFNNVVIRDDRTGGKGFSLVNVKLDEKPFFVALKAIASSAGAVVTQEDGIYYLSVVNAEASPIVATAQPATAQPAQEAAAPRRLRNREHVRIALNYIKPSEVKGVLLNPDFLATTDLLDQERRAAAGDVKIITPTGPTFNILPTPGTMGASGAAAGRDSDDAYSAGQRGGGGGRGFGGGQGGGFGAGQGGGGFGGGAQGGGGQAGGAQGGALGIEGIDNIISNEADNTLIVQGDAAGIEELRSLIRLLDVPPKQVLIKAEFVQVSIADADSFGITWNLTPANNINATTQALGNANSIQLAYASGNAVANLRATATRSTTNIIQSPIITTVNNRPASVTISDNVPFFTTQQVITGTGLISNQTQVLFAQARNGLDVTPHINGDNSISVNLQPILQTISFVTGPNGEQLPRTATQSLVTSRRIQNGETMVLGGFITKQEDRNTNKVPLLGDLPIIGSLFRSRDRTQRGTEILVFITMTIIEDRAQGVIGTGGSSAPPTP